MRNLRKCTVRPALTADIGSGRRGRARIEVVIGARILEKSCLFLPVRTELIVEKCMVGQGRPVSYFQFFL